MKPMCILLVCCNMQLVVQYVAFLGDNTPFLVSGRRGRVSNLPASRDAVFAAVQIGF